MSIQLKQDFHIVKELRAASGFSWNDQEEKVTAPRDVWDAYIEVSNALPRTANSRVYFTDTPGLAHNGE
jgi:hypothetical protein